MLSFLQSFYSGLSWGRIVVVLDWGLLFASAAIALYIGRERRWAWSWWYLGGIIMSLATIALILWANNAWAILAVVLAVAVAIALMVLLMRVTNREIAAGVTLMLIGIAGITTSTTTGFDIGATFTFGRLGVFLLTTLLPGCLGFLFLLAGGVCTAIGTRQYLKKKGDTLS